MNKAFRISSAALPGIRLRTADRSDAEALRAWKNAHRAFFFFQGIIDRDAQLNWLTEYFARPDDWMFVVEAGDDAIGCMGFRKREGQADVYNVLLGRPEFKGRGIMAQAFRLMCSFAQAELGTEVVANVMTHNPAIGWYAKCGFDVVAQKDSHVVIKLDRERFAPVDFAREALDS